MCLWTATEAYTMMWNLYLQHVIAFTFLIMRFVGAVQLTQETPCLQNQSCLLKCDLESNSGNFVFTRGANRSSTAAICTQQFCDSIFPTYYNITRVSNSLSFLEILRFASYDADFWSCSDGPNGQAVFIQVAQNNVPLGPLIFGTTPCRVVSPASVTCSLPTLGSPPATLTIVDSSNQSVNSSQTGSVTGTVTRGGQASCSVTWSAFPSFPLNINPVLCDVQVTANVTISVMSTTGQHKVITCQAEGYPDIYTFQPWLQSWEGQEVRRLTGSQQGGLYNLTLTSYQDSGTYTCTVDNGVLDSSGRVIWRAANTTVNVEETPVLPLPSDPPLVSGEEGEPVRLYRSVFASPDLTSHTWFFNSTDVTSLIPGATTNRSRDMVSLPVHGTTVTTEGTVINLYLTVSQQYSGLYRLQACNTIGCNSATVTVVAAAAPSPPESLAAKFCTDSVVLFWTPGFAGGDFVQWFHVQYRRQDSQEGQWSDVSTAENRSSSDRTPVTVTVQGLQPDTSYVFRVRAQSSRPQQNLSNYTEVTVTTDPGKDGLYPGSSLAAAVVVTAVLTSAVTLATTYVAMRLRRKSRPKRQNTLAEYQNVAYRQQQAAEHLESLSGRPQTAADPRLPKEEGAYSVLDPGSRDLPRVPPVYQGLAQAGLHGNPQSRDTGDQGNQTYTNAPVEGPYTMPYDVTR